MEKIITNEIYSCGFCGANYEDKEKATEHMISCLFNFVDNKTCYTCEHAIEVKEAPFKGKESGYVSSKVINLLGPYDYIKCGLTKEKVEEEKLYELEQPCWVKFTEQDMKRETTEEYEAYKALVEEAIEQEEAIGKEILKEYNKEE